ncbi:MAG: nucleoside-triphosphatase [bacterium]
MSIVIYTGKINSGKTTSLLNWSSKQKGVKGFLQTKQGEDRFLTNIETKENLPLTTNEYIGEDAVVKFCAYTFIKETFVKVNKEMISIIDCMNEGTIIIDEWGYVEEKNEGMHNAILHVMANFKQKNIDFIIVVRERLVDSFIKKYKLIANEYRVIDNCNEL